MTLAAIGYMVLTLTIQRPLQVIQHSMSEDVSFTQAAFTFPCQLLPYKRLIEAFPTLPFLLYTRTIYVFIKRDIIARICAALFSKHT